MPCQDFSCSIQELIYLNIVVCRVVDDDDWMFWKIDGVPKDKGEKMKPIVDKLAEIIGVEIDFKRDIQAMRRHHPGEMIGPNQ
ncbi:hypothetical protein J6590_043432 [Homalodisca vitripennis]|nr:hypothetical protein J6590_043432 [Homalodisca vitripennis]